MDKNLVNYELSSDTGDTIAVSIAPVLDTENATQVVLQRPTENLRQRSETIRSVLEELRYLSDADRTFYLTGGGKITWAGVTLDGGATLGNLTTDADIVIRPFAAPAVCLPALLDIGGILLSTRTAVSGGNNPLRAYGRLADVIPGANHFSFEIVHQAAAPKSLAPYGDGRHWKLIVDDTRDTIAAVNAFLTTDVTADANILEFRKRYTGTVTSGSPGNFIAPLAKTYFSKALDAELHRITSAALVTFFATNTNRMIEGDVLCVRYDALTMQSGGGRRQSMDQAPESNSSIPAASLFLIKNHPEWAPFALPVATVFNGNLVLADGHRAFEPGVAGHTTQRGGNQRLYALSQFILGGGVTTDTLRASLDGVGGAGAKDGRLKLYRDGAAAMTLDYDALAALVNHGDANAYHTHAVLLQRWLLAVDLALPASAVMNNVFTFNFATSFANQMIELDINLFLQLPAGLSTGVNWQILLDAVSAYTNNIPSIDASSDPDVPDVPVNDTIWITVAAAGPHTLTFQVATPAQATTLKTHAGNTLGSSRATLS